MERYKEMEDMLCDEIDRIVDQKNLNSSSLDMLDKLTHTLKSIKTIDAMDHYDDGYSMDSMSYARGRSKRDSMGRYSSEGRYEDRYPTYRRY
jgi:hypothetical protein